MFKKFSKKITAGIMATALGFSLTVSVPSTAEAAIGIGDAISIGATLLSASQYSKQISQQVEYLNNNEEGREALYQTFREKYGVNNDPTLNARLDKIMENLTRAVGKVDSTVYDRPYKYFVANQESLNAACGMGRVMMVNSGTFYLLPSDDEIAAVVGHEMGHGQKEHVAKGQQKNITKQVIAQIGSAAVGGGALANTVISVVANNSIQHTNKKNETEADNLAWEYIVHSDYNIGSCAAVMQKLAELSKDGGKDRNKIEALINPSDHPGTLRRRDNYVNKLYEYSGKHATAKDGVVEINGKTFTTVAAANKMSSVERSYFVLGNLAKAYHNGKTSSTATVSNGTIYLGDMAIMTPAADDEDAYVLAERLNELIASPNTNVKNESKSKDKKSKDKK